MNNIIDDIKKNSLYVITVLLLLLFLSHCSNIKHKNLVNRYLIEAGKSNIELKIYIDSVIAVTKKDILLLEKEYDSADSTIFSLKEKLNVSE